MDESKETIYSCLMCNYASKRKYNYDCHLLTKRHKTKLSCDLDEEVSDGDNKDNIFQCKCCKYSTYKSCNYVKHLKTSKHKIYFQSEENKPSGLQVTEAMFCELLKSNQHLANVVQNGTNSMVNCHNTSISNNTTFNLHFFLNDTCKDAMNLKDFIESIEVSISDLKKLGNKGS
jgi:hypothetical protein